ncbi:MAG: dephospho-CoA kinase [Steroidobacteraceae bacterium]
MATNAPLRIGLTGGIASGKSVVATEFAKLSVPIIDTDMLARAVVQPGQPALAAMVSRFGNAILLDDGTLDRRQVRQRIFNNPAEKQALEAILHPAIRSAQNALATQLGGAYQIHVVPLLIDTQTQHLYDRILVVDCTPETQLARLLLRDDINSELAQQMLATQVSRDERLKFADDILDNNGSVTEIPEKVAVLHRRYLDMSNAAT